MKKFILIVLFLIGYLNANFELNDRILKGEKVHFPLTQIEIFHPPGFIEICGYEWEMKYIKKTQTVILYMVQWVGALSYYRSDFVNPGNLNEIKTGIHKIKESYIGYDGKGNQTGVIIKIVNRDMSEEKRFIKYYIESTFRIKVKNI